MSDTGMKLKDNTLQLQSKISFDRDILSQIGYFGKYQILRCIILSLVAIPIAFGFAIDFVLFCNPVIAAQCEIYNAKVAANDTQNEIEALNTPPEIQCVAINNRIATSSVFILGMIFGTALSGWAADRFGRKSTAFCLLAAHSVFGLFVAFMSNYVVFLIARFFLGATLPGIYIVLMILAVELVGPSYRIVVVFSFEILYAVGLLCLAFISKSITSWGTLQIIIILPSFLYLLTWILIPESPRWLLVSPRVQEAREIIHAMANSNGRDDSNIQPSIFLSGHEGHALDELGQRTLRYRIVVLFFIWLGVFIVHSDALFQLNRYFAKVERQRVDTYYNFNLIMWVVTDLVSGIYTLLWSIRHGHRSFFGILLCMAALTIISSTIVRYKDFKAFIMISIGLEKNIITGVQSMGFLYTIEVLPTSLRGTGFGLTVMCGKIGAAVIPLISSIAESNIWLVITILGAILCVIGAIFLYTFPETKGYPLLETRHDLQELNSTDEDGIHNEVSMT